jgi:FMN phosphatase YigB (HAD superfamily)
MLFGLAGLAAALFALWVTFDDLTGTQRDTWFALLVLARVRGAGSRVQQVLTVEEVRAYMPHPEPYHHVARTLGLPSESLTLIAAHGWDVLGARATGLSAIWVERLERRWPFPTAQPRSAGTLIGAVELALAEP